ncbi:MAG: PP2C family protein-serine/threonine phosphatase [Terracidiphilus sp.]
MTRSLSRSLGFAVFLVCVGFLALAASAQPPGWNNPRSFNPFYLGARVPLGPDWLFSTEDNPAFASPTYDDSSWKIISVDRPLYSYGIRNISYAWYRIHVHVHPTAHYLAIETQYIAGSYELYVNGVRIGANGRMNGLRESSQDYLTSYDIPDSMIAPNGDLVIALRFALNRTGPDRAQGTSTPFNSGGIMISTGFAALRDATYEATHQAMIPLILCGLNLLVGLVALALYLAMRSRLEYLAIAISLLAAGLQSAVIAWTHLHTAGAGSGLFGTLWLGVTNVALIEFVRLILRLPPSRWFLALEIATFLGYFASDLNQMGYLHGLPVIVAYFLPSLTAKALLCVLLLRGLLQGNRDSRVVLPAIAIVSIANYWYLFSVLSRIFRLLTLPVSDLPSLQIGTYSADFWSIWAVIYGITMLLFLVLRTIGIARGHARAAAELEAARTVQHVLIPDKIPTIPGFSFQSAYKPAGEVGGDFFQIVPTKNGGALVIIGDVSGKGMPAAMTVSLLVGTFRTLAHYTQSPGEILAAMNTRMLARSSSGFTTCLVLRVDPDCALTVANAGHIAPYLDGVELPLVNGLPLGISASTTYAESRFRLVPRQQVTLVTDGVVEARSKTGALFGFERTASVSIQSAEAIAHAAQAFGQEDDITAVTLIASAAPALA